LTAFQEHLTDLQSDMIREQTSSSRSRQVYPVISDSNPAVDQINEWLTRPFTLNLWFNNHLMSRVVASRERMSWMKTTVEMRGLVAHLNVEAIGKFLTEVVLELGPNAELRREESAAVVRAAMLRGDQSVWLAVPRRQLRYPVQAADTFESLADVFGIPAARLMAANPDVQLNDGTTDQQILIPSQSSMLPVSIQPDNLKHIEVNLASQQLMAYDGTELVLITPISSGIPKWRTLNGIFQVKGKEAEVVMPEEHVRLPTWLTLYDTLGTGNLNNGIHALPVMPDGKLLWEKALGKPASLGCIAMSPKEGSFLYQWADIGTPVVIHGSTPASIFRYDSLAEAQRADAVNE
jgi:lipoprotein-anchoring transpeptidase ErfK/SrfK